MDIFELKKTLKLNRGNRPIPNLKLEKLLQVWEKFRYLVLTRGAFLFSALMLANIIAYIYHMIMARMLTPVDYGSLVTLMSVSYVLDVILRTVQTWLTRTVSNLQKTSTGQVRLVFLLAIRVLVPLAIVVFIVIAISSRWVADFFHMQDSFPVVLLGLYAALHFLVPIPRGILLGLDRLKLSGITIITESFSRAIVGVILVLLGLKINGGMGGYAVGNLISFGLGLLFIWPALASNSHLVFGGVPLEGINRYAWMVLFTNICLMILVTLDQIFIKRYFSPEVAGNYAVTFVLGRVIVMTATSLGIVVFTRSATRQNNNPKQVGFLIKGLIVMGAISLATIIVTFSAPEFIVRVMAGSQYGIAQSFIGLVVIEMTLFGLVYVLTYYLISIDRMKVLWLLFVAVLFEITLLVKFHESVQQVLGILILIMMGLLISVSVYSWRVLREIRRQRQSPLEPNEGVLNGMQ